ncbi:MAG: hypothetical protein P4L53_24965 [Candidatus Obscuribacterales bacterium]|nr:hypothetical protein [Candidatus Obscuribacterales bacterium]
MKYISIAPAHSTYAVFVTRDSAEEVEATIVPAFALTDTGVTAALMPSQVIGDARLIPVESDEKREFKTFYFGNDPLSFIQQYQLKLREEKAQAARDAESQKIGKAVRAK